MGRMLRIHLYEQSIDKHGGTKQSWMCTYIERTFFFSPWKSNFPALPPFLFLSICCLGAVLGSDLMLSKPKEPFLGTQQQQQQKDEMGLRKIWNQNWIMNTAHPLDAPNSLQLINSTERHIYMYIVTINGKQRKFNYKTISLILKAISDFHEILYIYSNAIKDGAWGNPLMT